MKSKLFPIFFLSKPGKDLCPSETTKKCIRIYDKLAEEYGTSVNILTGIEAKAAYEKEFPHCKIYCHEFNALENVQHIPSMIRNRILDLGKMIDADWLYMLDDDFALTWFDDSAGVERIIVDVDKLHTALCIWQFYIEKDAGIVGMPVVNSFSERHNVVDDVRLCQGVLLNRKKLEECRIRYDETQTIWEDFDLLIQIAHEGLHQIGIRYPIHFTELRGMCSRDSSVVYDVNKLNRLSINLYRKWGKKIIPYFRPNPGYKDALNVKVGSCAEWMQENCPIEFDQNVLDDLDRLEKSMISFDEFSKKHIVKNDYKIGH